MPTKTKQPKTDSMEERWVDIIREWQTEPYPPIRPLAKKISKALSQARREVFDTAVNLGKSIDGDTSCPKKYIKKYNVKPSGGPIFGNIPGDRAWVM